MTNEDFLEKALQANDNRYDILSNFKGWRSKLDVRCKKCRVTRSVRADSLLKGIGCPSCNALTYKGKYTKSTKDYRDEVLTVSYGEYDLVGEYTGVHEYTQFKHLDCGNIYKAKPFQFNRGRRCPHCKNSKGEVAISNFLTSISIPYESQVTNKTLPNLEHRHSYDFYIPSLNALIEYQGIQHYEPVEAFGGVDNLVRQQKSDEYKRRFAKDNGYTLIEVPYTEDTPEKVSSFLETVINNIIDS